MPKKVMNDFVKTAQAIKEGKNLVVKRITKKDGTKIEIYASNASTSDWKYMGSADEGDFENENDFVDDIDDEFNSANNLDALKTELFDDNGDLEQAFTNININNELSEDDVENIIAVGEKKADWGFLNYLNNAFLTANYTLQALESDIYKYFQTLEGQVGNSNSYMKGLSRMIGFNFASELTKALRGGLNAIPFRDIKKMFNLPSKMNSWKDLKTNKSMDKDMKDRIRAFKALHKGGSLLIEKGIRAIKNNKPLPNGLSKRDIRKLFIIMIANKSKKGGK